MLCMKIQILKKMRKGSIFHFYYQMLGILEIGRVYVFHLVVK